MDVDDPGFSREVGAQILGFATASGMTKDVSHRNHCMVFDSWLAFKWDGRYSVIGEERLKEFYAHKGAASSFALFIDTLGRQVVRCTGSQREVRQLMPKGGWYAMMHGYVCEYHLRILRAILGLIPLSVLDVAR